MRKAFKIAYILVTLFFVGWAINEQTKTTPNIWIQIVAVILFFYAMSRLMSKTSSNTMEHNPADREFNTAIKRDLMDIEKQEKDAK